MNGLSRPSLVILTHSSDDFWEGRPFAQLMIPVWEEMGFSVAVRSEADPFVPADVAMLHVDLSVVPESCLRLAQRYPQVLNGAVHDIRKRRFSRHLLEPGDPYRGPVIVKTDRNHGGWREFRRGVLESPAGPLLRRMNLHDAVCRKLARLDGRRSWRRRRVLPAGRYPVFASPAAVPDGVWENPHLIVQRLVPERAGENYCCRHWLFFGHEEVHRRTISPHPVIKADAPIEPLSEAIPEELRAVRAAMGFDYGKFDYGLVDGEVILYDANRTPGTAADVRRHAQTLAVLSRGLRDVLATPGARASALAAGC